MLRSSRTTNILLIFMIVVGIALAAMLAGDVRGGPLDPPGPVASTGLPIDEAGSWSRKLSGVDGTCNSERFKCVLPTPGQPTGEGVLDRETGLVWQRTISSSVYNWRTSRDICARSTAGERMGWRLPTRAELASLANASGIGVPVGMPASGGVASEEYWASTLEGVGVAWGIDFDNTTTLFYASSQDYLMGHWCVRGSAPGDHQEG